MDNSTSDGFDILLIIDASFQDECEGGDITGSRNVRSIAHLKELFREYRECNVCVVFHSEFSQNRGPTMMRALREYDRSSNVKDYPKLCYPFIFLLPGGYQQFYEDCPDRCAGESMSMRDQRFVEKGTLKKSHSAYFSDVVRVDKLSLLECRNSSFEAAKLDENKLERDNDDHVKKNSNHCVSHSNFRANGGIFRTSGRVSSRLFVSPYSIH
jgi:hypothetical protein